MAQTLDKRVPGQEAAVVAGRGGVGEVVAARQGQPAVLAAKELPLMVHYVLAGGGEVVGRGCGRRSGGGGAGRGRVGTAQHALRAGNAD